MDLIAGMGSYGYGEVHVRVDPATGLRAIVAIHSTLLGPALGGCRFIHYDDEGSAFTDALRLARGMTSKAALAGLNLGGGKSVIIKPRGDFDRVALFRAFGDFIDNLGGRYITVAGWMISDARGAVSSLLDLASVRGMIGVVDVDTHPSWSAKLVAETLGATIVRAPFELA